MPMRRVISRPRIGVVVRAPVVAGTDPDERRWGNDCDGWRLGSHHTASRCEFAKSPDDETDSPKMLASPGAKAELYGWEDVLYKPEEIVICEGEFDRLALKAQGFRAVTSTGGARVFRPEWAQELAAIPQVYIC